MKLQDLTIQKISQIYFGKDNHCRCGCGGTYVATSYMIEPRSAVDDTEAEALLRKAKKYDKIHNCAEYGETYINIPLKNNKCYCIYFDEVKK